MTYYRLDLLGPGSKTFWSLHGPPWQDTPIERDVSVELMRMVDRGKATDEFSCFGTTAP